MSGRNDQIKVENELPGRGQCLAVDLCCDTGFSCLKRLYGTICHIS